MTTEPMTPSHFIRKMIDEDQESGRFDGRVHTRFPPEPNGYLHIGHAKATWLDYGMALEYGGKFNLRFDDTNPAKEEQEYIDGVKDDLHWLGFDWEEREFYASDYFEQLYDWAVQLIKADKAYVDSLSADEMREYRGTLTEPGKDSPYRNRSIEENLDLFERMRAGEFEEGTYVLRAKIDMASGNLNMRDPAMYRILNTEHPRTGTTWHIYPMYDWAHGQCDSIERITHSLCTLEYEDHRPLYDWFLDQLDIYHPQQIEFARLKLSHTVLSKRRLIRLVEDGHVTGWDDPRMPTIAGLRRRGYTPEAISDFCERIGVAKNNSTVDIALLEHTLRDHLNKHAPRMMGVLKPLKLVIDNYPEGQVEEFEVINNPEDPDSHSRVVPFSREIYIEQSDFMTDPPKKFFRLGPGREVRLKSAYYVTCTDVEQDKATGEILAVHCHYDPESRGGGTPDGRKVRGTLHWVSAEHAIEAEVRLYDHLFANPDPDDVEEGADFLSNLNPNSLEVLSGCQVEPNLADTTPGTRYQFLRQGYFVTDPDSTADRLVFNRAVSLRDTWAKMQKKK